MLVDFWAEWCGPCRRLAPTVDALASEFDGRATVAKLNVDENPNVPGRFAVRGIPTLLLFKEGQLAETIVGLRGEGRHRADDRTSSGSADVADRKVVIIGSGPAGLTAALYTARANLKPLLVEGLEAGGQLMLTTMVENWPGFRDGIMGPDLMTEMRAQAERFGTEVMQGNVTQRRSAAVGRSRLTFADGKSVTTDALIIATGASARWLEIGSDRKLSGHGVSTCATCDGYFFRGKPIAVVGGGDSAMEEAIYLTRFASKVTVVHRRDTLRASKIMQDKAFANPKIEFIWDSEVAEVNDGGKGEVDRHRRPQPEDRSTERRCRSTACSSPSATRRTRRSSRGRSSSTRTATSSRTHGSKTNVPGVFAAGDVQDHIYRQAITAAGSGCMAAHRRRALPRRAARIIIRPRRHSQTTT